MNREAFDAITAAQRAYLLANGWTEREPDKWTRAPSSRREYAFGHAVNSQLFYDRTYVEPPPPPTDEQLLAHFRKNVSLWFAERHDGGPSRQTIRSSIRSIARTLEKLGRTPDTRVARARLARALHAGKHRNTGCPCGKEGPPY